MDNSQNNNDGNFNYQIHQENMASLNEELNDPNTFHTGPEPFINQNFNNNNQQINQFSSMPIAN